MMHVQIQFDTCGHDGVVIESRTDSGPWKFLGIGAVNPYVDVRPLAKPNVPEFREYRLRFWSEGKAKGEWSPIQSVAVTE